VEDNSLKDFIEEVLVHEFKGVHAKHEVIQTSKGYNFACPYCGDSSDVAAKKRGNIYMKSKTFKCFNDGCFQYAPLREFIKKFAQKHKISIMDLDIDFDDIGSDNSKYKMNIAENNTIYDYLEDVDVLPQLMPIDYFTDRFSLKSVATASQSSNVYKFLKERHVHLTENWQDFIFYDTLDDKIYIFNYDKKTNKVLGFATRHVAYKRYKIYPYSDILGNAGLENTLKDNDIVNLLSNYFNILNVNFHSPMQVTEGQIDSLFLNNSIAISGLSKMAFISEYIDSKNTFIFFDRDNAGTRESIKYIKNGYNLFMWSLLISKMKKSFNPYVPRILKIKDTNNLFSFLHDITKLDIVKFNEIINKYYTNSFYDMFYL
jgi:hypothetical protein